MDVLLIEDNAADADLIEAKLAEVAPGEIALRHVERLSQAFAQLETVPVDVVLLDLSLPDAQRLQGVHRIRERFPQLPIVVLTGGPDELGIEAVKNGAQDYLLKGQATGDLLLRSMRYAVERQRVAEGERQLVREKAARAIVEQQAKLLDELYDAVIAFDVDGAVGSWNRAAERIFGWPRDEVIGRRLEDVLPSEFEGGLSVQAVRASAARDGHFSFRARRKTHGGRWLEIEGTTAAILTEHGALAGYVTINRDVTEQRRAEEARGKSERRLRLHVESTPVAIIEWDEQHRVSDWNPAAKAIFGWPAEEAMGRHASFIVPELARSHVDGVFRQFLGGKSGRSSVHENVTKDGRIITCDWNNTTLYSPDGEVIGLASMVLDITDRKQAEEALRRSETRFRALIEKSTDLIVVLDDEARYQFWSPSATEALGWKAEEVLGRTVFELIHSDDRPRFTELFAGLLDNPGATAGAPIHHQHRDGTWRQLEVHVRNLLGEPAVRGLVLNGRDVTEQRSLEEQLEQAQKLESVGLLAGGIAHDFNNILSVILSGAEFALEGLREGDPLRDDILEIEKAGTRAATLTRQLLAFSRKQVLQPEPLDLNRILAEMETMLHRLLREDIELVQVLARDLGIVKADPGQIEQVVMNLAVNARDAMPEGGKLTIETANVELDADYAAQHVGAKPGPHVMLAVSDSGVGMDASTKARVFEPFFTTKGPGKGSGLGLSTVYGIVKQSGGSIYVYSEPGRGATFKVYLARELSLAPIFKRAPTVTRSGGVETVLVVEDDEAVRSVARRILDAAGYTVLVAANGGEGLLLCEQHPAEIQLVLTDVVMPLMGGRAFVERLAKIRPDVKVLYMSGYTNNAIVHHGVLDEGTEFIGKPFTQSELLRKVREVLDG